MATSIQYVDFRFKDTTPKATTDMFQFHLYQMSRYGDSKMPASRDFGALTPDAQKALVLSQLGLFRSHYLDAVNKGAAPEVFPGALLAYPGDLQTKTNIARFFTENIDPKNVSVDLEVKPVGVLNPGKIIPGQIMRETYIPAYRTAVIEDPRTGQVRTEQVDQTGGSAVKANRLFITSFRIQEGGAKVDPPATAANSDRFDGSGQLKIEFPG